MLKVKFDVGQGLPSLIDPVPGAVCRIAIQVKRSDAGLAESWLLSPSRPLFELRLRPSFTEIRASSAKGLPDPFSKASNGPV
jgi:hypothetical protein